MTTTATSPSILVPALRQAEKTAGARTRRVLVLALGVSLLLHLGLTLWPAEFAVTPEERPLTATLTELPPPPRPSLAPQPAPSPKPRKNRVSTAASSVPSMPGDAASLDKSAAEESRGNDAPQADAAPVAAAAPEITPGATTGAKTLPPRVDLAYKVFYGTRGFLIGEAIYRFEHSGSHYRIATIGEARGLAALILRGQGRIESRGLITDEGLQPLVFRVERGGPDRVETATFDWEAGIVNLHDNKTAPLDIPTFDPLALMWQYYFTPPTEGRVTFSVATPRRVYRYTMTREATEPIEGPGGTVEAERWHRRSEDGKTDAYVWLAPSLRFVPVKMRVSNTDRGTIEVLLDAIRVDENAASVEGGELKFDRARAGRVPATQSEVVPGENSGPGETFPTMTGQ